MDAGLAARLEQLRNDHAEAEELYMLCRSIGPNEVTPLLLKYIALQSDDIQRECRVLLSCRKQS